ncbi:ATP-binding cassette domain-containing protein [Actinopolyspora saharensis]|uniref:ABC transporter n=1 Tax=Actinopolyspora saharensis TaxID=995062 RepID=A0A1H1AF39_9ACTN|nr:ATP-binding cassette domain-containing protein [Actinopolyspora saharensis]SDQ38333.1 ABC transporter [Actinopolyspora saharensis]
MEIVATGVEVAGPHGPLLEPTSLHVRSGELLLVAGPPGSGRTALALALSGRLRPDSGTVLRNGHASPVRLRRTTAVVDSAGITEPEGSVELSEAVAEGLGLAGRPFGRRAVHRWLSERGLHHSARKRFEQLAPELRTRVLLDLARTARGTEALILDCPDRHGGDPLSWYTAARETATHGYAVVALCAPQTARELNVRPIRIGSARDSGTEQPVSERTHPTPTAGTSPRTAP